MNKKLTLSSDEMRKLGYQVIDDIIAHVENLSEKPVLNIATTDELKSRLPDSLPEHATDLDTVMTMIREHILGNISHGDHPRFFCLCTGAFKFCRGDG